MPDNPTPESGQGYALLIGIRYEHWAKMLRPLKGTLKDVQALNAHFTDPAKAGFLPGNVIALTEEKATGQGIRDALDKFVEMVNKDAKASVIIYYAGHGERDEKNYFLVPYDFDLLRWRQHRTYDEDKVVLSKDFAAKIGAIQAKKSLIMLDCCHSENIPQERTLSSGPDFLEGFIDDLDTTIEEAVPLERTLLPALKKGSGKVILTSCEAGETSLDLGTNGLFTSVLLECLNGAQNIEKDGWVRLLDVMRYVPKTVKEKALRYNVRDGKPHRQNPVFKRIENLSAEEFIICAYDMATVRSLQAASGELPIPEPKQPAPVEGAKREDVPDYSISAIEKALNEADYVSLIDLLDDHFAGKPTPQYSTLKQTIMHHLNQGLMPPPATLQGLKILIKRLL